MCLHAYKLKGIRSPNTNSTIGTSTYSFVVNVRHGLSTKTKTKKDKLINNVTNGKVVLYNGAF
jgi:hypothetical protein